MSTKVITIKGPTKNPLIQSTVITYLLPKSFNHITCLREKKTRSFKLVLIDLMTIIGILNSNFKIISLKIFQCLNQSLN